MAKMPTPKVPKALKMPSPKAEIGVMPGGRTPLRTSGGKDIISITTRMRETPTKKGKY
ncbi:hypothetical protein [Fluviibacter sp.]